MFFTTRISGPLLDRIDPKRSDHIEVPRVEAAREQQRKRFEGIEGVACNSDMRPADVRKYCALDDAGSSLMMALQNSAALKNSAALQNSARR